MSKPWTRREQLLHHAAGLTSPIWDMRHTVILERLVADRQRDYAIARAIAAETGDTFAERTVAEHRRQLGYRACRA